MDINVYLDILAYRAKENYGIAPQLIGATYLTALTDGQLKNLTRKDVEFAPCGRKLKLQRDDFAKNIPARRSSGSHFESENSLSFKTLENALCAAVVFPDSREPAERMPYASGGALYSVQVFICRVSDNVTDWNADSNALHLLPFSRELEQIETSQSTVKLLEILSGGDSMTLGKPHFAILYAVYLDKAIFKYRYRGYRLASMEVGAMFQNITLELNAYGLDTRMWAGFNDFSACRALNLDVCHVLPMVVQFIGRGGT